MMAWASGTPVLASESWTCTKIAQGKAFPIKYVVNGNILLHGDGSAHSKTMLNDDRLLISFGSFMSSVRRYPKNSRPVDIDEPFVNYFIIDKIGSRLILLGNVGMTILSDMYGSLGDASLEELRCTRG
jgi:hypothetical protein